MTSGPSTRSFCGILGNPPSPPRSAQTRASPRRPCRRCRNNRDADLRPFDTLSAKTSADQYALVGASIGGLRLSQLAKWAILAPKRRSKRPIPTLASSIEPVRASNRTVRSSTRLLASILLLAAYPRLHASDQARSADSIAQRSCRRNRRDGGRPTRASCSPGGVTLATCCSR